MKNTNLPKKFKITLGIIVYKFLLDFIYSNYITSIFGYIGFYVETNTERYILSWILLLFFLPLIISIHKKTTFSGIIMILLVYLSVIPFFTMVGYYPFSVDFIIQNTVYWFIMVVIYNIFPKINLVRIKNDSMVNIIINTLIFLFFAVIIYISWKYTGFRITFDIFNVYDLRKEVTTFNIPTILIYIYYASKAVNPILIVYYLSRKKYKMAGFITFIQLLSFSINGSKTVFFSTLLAIFLYLMYKEKYKNSFSWMFSVITALGIFEFLINKTFFIINFIIRRVLFLPNLLNYYYFDFFSMNTPDYFRQSFLRNFGLESPYSSINYLIGDIYFNKPEMGANNGLISDAYTNFGILGLLIMPLILVFSLKFLDACARGLDTRLYIASGITLAFIFVSSFFFTILVTHGYLIMCLILYLLPRSNKFSEVKT